MPPSRRQRREEKDETRGDAPPPDQEAAGVILILISMQTETLFDFGTLESEPEPLTPVPVPKPAVPKRFRFQKRMEITLDHDPYLPISVRDDRQFAIATPDPCSRPATRVMMSFLKAEEMWRSRNGVKVVQAEYKTRRFSAYSRIMHLMYTATLIIMYPPLIAFVQIKFQNENYSPFDTHGCFMIMSIVALPVATFTSGVLFYLNDPLQNSITKHLSNIHYTILQTISSFSGILTPFSLIMVLFIPHNLNWVGFSVTFILLGVVVTCHFYFYIKLVDKKRECDVKLAHQILAPNLDRRLSSTDCHVRGCTCMQWCPLAIKLIMIGYSGEFFVRQRWLAVTIDTPPFIATVFFGEALATARNVLDDNHAFIAYSRILHLMYTATLIVMYVPLIAFIQIKFQNESYSPFDTHGCFMIMSIVALPVATFTSIILFYLDDPLQKSTTKL
ncbi:hypothetical protein OSB04_020637 [Centaurea solstitialis]|uniref:Uncharacterized protein n=1 Tax=Centaurea solstitialis TaxID=347529 RepID=A0AA38SU91_9ASTR|nr:hypothetical protein OSB04_020637 [Centaurea solstitialis]